MFWESIGQSDLQLKRGLRMYGLGIFVRLSLVLGRSIVNPDENILFKLYVYSHTDFVFYRFLGR